VKLGQGTRRTNSPKWVVIGEQDDVVDPIGSWSVLSSMVSEGMPIRMVTCNWLGHQIDIETYKESCYLASLHILA